MLRFAVVVLIVGLTAGCSSQPKSADLKEPIESSLKSAGLNDVSVSQDREKGVVTLGGHVQSQEDKDKAASLAQAIAAGQVVANEVLIQPPPSAKIAKEVSADEDAAIEKNLDATFTSAGLKGVKHKTKNGVVKLTGSVPGDATRKQAELATQQVPNVQQVVNEINVDQKAATTNN